MSFCEAINKKKLKNLKQFNCKVTRLDRKPIQCLPLKLAVIHTYVFGCMYPEPICKKYIYA